MCVFVGFTTVDYDAETNRSIVKDMADRIIHRGPDEDGYFVNDNIAMGFRRFHANSLGRRLHHVPRQRIRRHFGHLGFGQDHLGY